jgi:hypothetical protein
MRRPDLGLAPLDRALAALHAVARASDLATARARASAALAEIAGRSLTDPPPFLTTLAELEGWCVDANRTAQATFRVWQKPRWLFRINKVEKPRFGYQYVQATDERLDLAVGAAFEAFYTHEAELPPEVAGRKGRRRTKKEEER